jgi:carbonic anhydrase/acetyltransferase-like protein (isoleucine patch superfamily)
LIVIYTLAERRPEFRGEYFVAPDATVIGSVIMEPNSSIWFKSVVRADNDVITIGEGSNIQDMCVLHVDPGVPLSIGNRVSIAHQVMLHGCTIKDRTLIGMNAVVLNNAVIGEDCIIGANCLIAEGKEIPPRSLVVGSPGRIVRTLSDEQLAGAHRIAQSYIDKAIVYRANLEEWQG